MAHLVCWTDVPIYRCLRYRFSRALRRLVRTCLLGSKQVATGQLCACRCCTCFTCASPLADEHLEAVFWGRSSYGNRTEIWSLRLARSVCIKFKWFKLKLLVMSAPISKSIHRSRLWMWNNVIVNSYYRRYYAMYYRFFPRCFILRTNSVLFINFFAFKYYDH